MSLAATLIGRTLGGRFRVTGFIGEGAMASVYRGVQDAEPHDIALKVMHEHLLGDATFVGRFRREARAAAQIVHPNTVRILDFGIDGTILYIAMELLSGRDLFETLVLERRLSEQRAAKILIEVSSALIAAHEQGIVHRDLKPENIMIVSDPDDSSIEHVKVLDFGIAKILEKDGPSPSEREGGYPSTPSSSVLTTVGTVVGTPAYMSPEQCRGEAIDIRSDIYSCGVLLFQLVTGRLPFSGDSAMDLAVKHVRALPPPPRSLTPGIHEGLEQIILTALGKWPAQRQSSAHEFKRELEKIFPELSTKPLDLAQASATPGAADAHRRSAQQRLDTSAVNTLSMSLSKATVRSSNALQFSPSKDPSNAPTLTMPEPELTELSEKATAMRSGVTRASTTVRRKREARARAVSWLLIPLALVVGIAVGVLAFLISR